jgi:hypothetical protein
MDKAPIVWFTPPATGKHLWTDDYAAILKVLR